MFKLSIKSIDLSTESDSPVIIDSFTWRFTSFIILQSAGTRSPDDSFIKSPGTISLEFICFSIPFLMTSAVGEASSFKARSAFSALYSCINPRAEFIIKMTSITSASVISFMIIPEINAAPIRIHIIKSLNWEINILKGERPFFSSSSLYPDSSSLFLASSSDKPDTKFVLIAVSISLRSLLCQIFELLEPLEFLEPLELFFIFEFIF